MTQPTIGKYQFETGVYRPPSEGGSHSLLLRFTRNCPWNRCGFCAMYKNEKFEVRTPSEIKQDIDAMAALSNDIKQTSHDLGFNGELNQDVVVTLIGKHPELNYHQGFVMLCHWLQSGGETAFLQDANSLIMKTDALVDALQHLRSTFPSIKRVTTYARSKTIAHKSLKELKDIKAAGLDRLHVGLETGDDNLLKIIKKGVTAETHIKGGQKAMKAGFQLSEYWMPGLGGKGIWEAHAINTAKVINQINPDYIRSRPFYPLPGTPLYDSLQAKTFELLSPREQLIELQLFITSLNITSKVCFDHAGNYWKDSNRNQLFSHSYEGYKFPDEKERVLALIEEGLKAKNRRPNIQNL